MPMIEYIFFSLIFSTNSLAQNRANVWMLGISLDDNHCGIDFNSGTAYAFFSSRPLAFFITNASICDTGGNILFYTNGQNIENNHFLPLNNSSDFNPGYATDVFYFDGGGLGIDQGAIILPKPGNAKRYILAYETFDVTPVGFEPLHLSYSEIDMELDGGLGGITDHKNVHLINDSLVLGRLTACKHANGRDWWLVAHQYLTNRFYKWLIQPDTILGPFEQDIGSKIINDVFGQACFSPDGYKYAMVSEIDDTLNLLDFDRCTGTFSNPHKIEIPLIQDWTIGCAFSPNNRFLYVCSFLSLFQFDMWSDNIEQSMLKVASWDTAYLPSQTWFHHMQLAPDNKIYIGTKNADTVVHVIDKPDLFGSSCELIQNSFFLSDYNACLPNFPNYDLGPLQNSPCDSLTLSSIDSTITVHISPNPTSDWLNIEYNSPIDELQLRLFDVSGRLITEMSLYPYFLSRAINISHFANGVYVYRVDDEKKIIKTGKVVKMD